MNMIFAAWTEGMTILAVGGTIFVLILLAVAFSYFRLWIQCWLTQARIGIFDLIGMISGF